MQLNLAIVHELAGTASHFGKTWCYPSQQTLLATLRKRYCQTISLRTLNRHLAALEAAGYVKRIHRHRQEGERGWTFRSTLYVLLGPVWKLVQKFAKAVKFSAGWSRVPFMANNRIPTGLKSPPPPPAAGLAQGGKEAAANFAASARKLLSKK